MAFLRDEALEYYKWRITQLTELTIGCLDTYMDEISGKNLYSLKTLLPKELDVFLTPRGTYQIGHRPNEPEISPAEFVEYIVNAAKQQGSTMPSRMGLEGIMMLLVMELKDIQQNFPPQQQENSVK